jgi:hypothetical protein
MINKLSGIEREIRPFVIGRNYPQSLIMSGLQQWWRQAWPPTATSAT